jgi:hypothetical protein
MKYKTLKLNKKQTKEMENLRDNSGAAYAAFEHASLMMDRANRAFWRWVKEYHPDIMKHKPKFNRDTNTFEYYEDE